MNRDKLIVKLANLSEKHGMTPLGILNNPKLLKGSGIKPEEITSSVIHSAEKHNQNEFTKMIDKFNQDKKFLCFVVPSEYPIRLLDGVLYSNICGFPVFKFLGHCGREGFRIVPKVQKILQRYGKEVPDSVVEVLVRNGASDSSLELDDEQEAVFFEIFSKY